MKLTLFVSSFLAAAASLNGATISVASQPASFDAFAPVVSLGGLLANGSGYVAIGATTLTDLQVGEIGTIPGFTAFLANFQQFGTSATFGGAGVFDEPSLFNFITSNSTIAGDAFVGNAITLVAGNQATLAASTELFVYKFGTTYGADAPLFTAEVLTTDPGTVLFGATASGIVLPNAGTNDGFSMAVVAIPEPSAALLGALGALGLLRRRRI